MKSETKYEFVVDLGDGRFANCWEAQSQEYSNCKISAGLVDGIDPDTLYFCFDRNDEEPTYIFTRPDELSALIYCCAGALWSLQIFEMDEKDK